MKRKQFPLLLVFGLLIAGILTACGGGDTALVVETSNLDTETIIVEGEQVDVARAEVQTEVVEAEVEVNDESAMANVGISATPPPHAQSNRQSQRLIIKNGEMTLTVQDADASLEQAIDTAVDFGGYVISQRSWEGSEGFRYGRVQMGVPVDGFEAVMKALRTLGTVTSEEASGRDVTDEFVDLNSRLGNLQATQTRLRTFLDQATNVTETLTVNAELTKIEEELGVIQGRMTFLSDRAAFSTITLDLQPWIPTATPSPTPTSTPTSTPTPIPTAESWLPSDTAKTAAVSLRNTSQDTADFVIYNGIVCGPWLLLFGLLVWGGLTIWGWWLRRQEKMPASPPPTSTE